MQIEILGEQMLGLWVCSDATDEELPAFVAKVNSMRPCGTENGWSLSTREECAPVACADNPKTHRHFVFDC
jgi:hypothetical protein